MLSKEQTNWLSIGPLQNQLRLSDEFIPYCKYKIGKNTRYPTKDSKKYLNEWRLAVSESGSVLPLDSIF